MDYLFLCWQIYCLFCVLFRTCNLIYKYVSLRGLLAQLKTRKFQRLYLHLIAWQKFEQMQLVNDCWHVFSGQYFVKPAPSVLLYFTQWLKKFMKHNIKIAEAQIVLSISEQYKCIYGTDGCVIPDDEWYL